MSARVLVELTVSSSKDLYDVLTDVRRVEGVEGVVIERVSGRVTA